MSICTEDGGMPDENLFRLETTRGRGNSGQGLLFRLSGAMVAAAVALLLILGTAAAQPAQAQVESVIQNFSYGTGTNPHAGLIMDSKGDLFGTAEDNGSGTTSLFGSAFELVYNSTTDSYTVKELHGFAEATTDGNTPEAGLVMDSNGNLYGTTEDGGSLYSSPSSPNPYPGAGTVFELYPSTNCSSGYCEKVLYSFDDTHGSFPMAGLVRDSNGNLYGTTKNGGSTFNPPNSQGDGTVFELYPSTNCSSGYCEKVLYSFQGGTNDGAQPWGGLVMDSAGNLFGTTEAGGAGYGTVFELSPPTTQGNPWTEKVLFSFNGGSDGSAPYAGLVVGPSGNFFGTTKYGGSSTLNFGTVFELYPDSNSSTGYSEKVLYSFKSSGTGDGNYPQAALITDSNGNFLGTTEAGGPKSGGTVFEVYPDSSSSTGYSERVLYSFLGGTSDGAQPYGGLVKDPSGNLYGTTYSAGSYGFGTAFGIAPVTLSATNLDFGSVVEGTTASKSVTIINTNHGTGALSFGNASFSGTDSGDFTIGTTDTCSGQTVGVGSSCSVSVNFKPSTTNSETASLNLMEGGINVKVKLTGTGLAPATVHLSTNNLTFPDTGVGSTNSLPVTLTNTSTTTALTITSYDFSNSDFALNTTGTNCGSSLQPGASCTIEVAFSPGSAVLLTGTLTIDDNTSSGSQTVTLSGTGVAVTATLSPAAGLTFPDTTVGATSAPQEATLKNTSSVDLSVTRIGVSPNFGRFRGGTCGIHFPFTLAAGTSCTIEVDFSPGSQGPLTGYLTVFDNASSSPQSINLSGTGVSITAKLLPTSLSFPDTIVGTTSASQEATLTNTSPSSDLSVTSIGVPDNFVRVRGGTCSIHSFTLAANASCTIAVAFSPSTSAQPQPLKGTLTVDDNANSSPQTVTLSGTGVTAAGYIQAVMVYQVEQLGVNNGQTNSLMKELDQAIRMIDQNKINGAIANLEQFIAEVNDLLTDVNLTNSQKSILNELKIEAYYVINSLE